MKVKKLMKHWQEEFGDELTEKQYSLPLSVGDAARIEALAEMFPSMTKEQLLRDIISAALDDLASGFPYVAGENVIAKDEEGFPMYEDIGLTPKFLQLSRKHLRELSDDCH